MILSTRLLDIAQEVMCIYNSIVLKFTIHEEQGNGPIGLSEDISLFTEVLRHIGQTKHLIEDVKRLGLPPSIVKNLDTELLTLHQIAQRSIEKMASRPRDTIEDRVTKNIVKECCWTLLHDLSHVNGIDDATRNALNDFKRPLE